jgi:hypothetical protein
MVSNRRWHGDPTLASNFPISSLFPVFRVSLSVLGWVAIECSDCIRHFNLFHSQHRPRIIFLDILLFYTLPMIFWHFLMPWLGV